ncbi:MAG: hypothetical protein JWN70_7162 [Planctomycetaceae bacterium]|nr:hypothetical protein [Planctomycetaceae bacterium]
MAEFDDRSYPIVFPQQRGGATLPPVPQEVTDAELSSDELLDAAVPSESAELAVVPSLVDQLVAKAQCPHPIWHPIRFVGWAVSMVFGIVTMVLTLAILAVIPIVNFIALGYLLDVEGRVARSGKFRDAFPLLPLAPRIGSMVIGIWIFLLPLRLLAWTAADARLISPGSAADHGWHFVLNLAMVLVTIHICLALARGGRFSTFFRPLKNLRWFMTQRRDPAYWDRAEQTVWEFLSRIRRTHFFWLGVKGWVGAFLWLVIPTAIFAAANKPNGGAALVSIVGGILLCLVFAWVPFLQARYAAEGRLSAFKELRTIRELYRRAPVCLSLAAILTYALSLPLFLATIFLPPQDALWMVTPIFIVSIFPARVFTGWAYHQAVQRTQRAWFSLRVLMGLVLMPTLMIYTFILFFTQFIGASGKLVLFQHHALLLPRPF